MPVQVTSISALGGGKQGYGHHSLLCPLLHASLGVHHHGFMTLLRKKGPALLFGVREEKLASVFLKGGNGRLAIGGHKPVPERHRGLILD
mgnify:CR=1 FL=1